MYNAFIINTRDDVVTVTDNIAKNQKVSFLDGNSVVEINAINDIPKYHKMAIHNVKANEKVYKYGEVIGRSSKDIFIGEHVHTQNLEDLPREEA